jgi:branched-subunit amino acid transport protein
VSAFEIFVTAIGMAIVTLVCRAFFVYSDQELPMPQWLRKGLHYAPIAALAAVVAPELVLTQGQLIDTWRDPRVFGACAGLAFYAWRRSLFGTIVCGTAVMLVLRFKFGW